MIKKIILSCLILLIAVPCFAGQLRRHIEPETVTYTSSPQYDGTNQFSLNEMYKSLKYNGGTITLSGLVLNISNASPYYFFDHTSLNLVKYSGFHVRLVDPANKYFDAVLGAVGSSEGLINKPITSWVNGTTYPFETFSASSGNILSAVNSSGLGNALSNELGRVEIGTLMKISVGSYSLVSGNTPFVVLSKEEYGGLSSPFSCAIETVYKTIVSYNYVMYLEIYNSTTTSFSAGGFTVDKVTAPSNQGMLLSGTPTVDSGFTYNQASYTAIISRY
ncbi:MAG: hypothetical protein ABFD76_15350 [Smithella sp.]